MAAINLLPAVRGIATDSGKRRQIHSVMAAQESEFIV